MNIIDYVLNHCEAENQDSSILCLFFTESVKESCSSKLLQAWLRTFEGSIVDMLQCLDVESCLELAEKTVNCLLKKVPAKELVQSLDILNEE